MDETMTSYARQCIEYLQRQIDPHDRLNPKYAYLQAQINEIVRRLADVYATEIPPIQILMTPGDAPSADPASK